MTSAGAALSAGAATADAIPMAGAVAHHSTLIKTFKLPSGDRSLEVSGILNPVNNPLNTLNKSVSDRSHPSLDKSLIPKMQPTLIRDQPLVPVCASISSVSSLSSSSVSSVSSSSSVSSAVSSLSSISPLSSTPHISPTAQIHPTSQSVGRIRKPEGNKSLPLWEQSSLTQEPKHVFGVKR